MEALKPLPKTVVHINPSMLNPKPRVRSNNFTTRRIVTHFGLAKMLNFEIKAMR
jgi:hypothetical protein